MNKRDGHLQWDVPRLLGMKQALNFYLFSPSKVPLTTSFRNERKCVYFGYILESPNKQALLAAGLCRIL